MMWPIAEGLTGVEYGVLGVISLSLLSAVLLALNHIVKVVIPDIHAKYASSLVKLVESSAAQQEKDRALYREQAVLEREACERHHKESSVEISRMHGENIRAMEAIAVVLRDSRTQIDGLIHTVDVHRAVIDDALGRKRTMLAGGPRSKGELTQREGD